MMNQKSSPVLDMIDKYVGHDLLSVFGKTGNGKSKFVMQIAKDAAKVGKKVYFYDTENNLNREEQKDLTKIPNITYKYDARYTMLLYNITNLPARYDYVIVDSTGFPILTAYATMAMNERGNALLALIAINGKLKNYCIENNATAIATTQPESAFGKDKEHRLRPFGDKSLYATKEIWEIIRDKSSPNMTKSTIQAFRSRSVGQDTKLATMEISNKGTVVIPVNVMRK